MPFIHSFIKTNGEVVVLVKPQFEVGKENIGKGGIVKDKKLFPAVIKRIQRVALDNHFKYVEHISSPLLGGDGNQEFLMYLKKIDFTKKVAFIFGSEASVLSNYEVSYANYTLQIPTNPEFKSLNLSHSLIIIAQCVSNIIKSKTSNFKKSKKVKAASKKEIHSMTNLCIQNLDEINFFKPKEKKPIMLENLRNIFYRMELSAKETRILASVFASLGKKR